MTLSMTYGTESRSSVSPSSMRSPFARYDAQAIENRRLQPFRWIQGGKQRPAGIARKLGVSRADVSIWWSRFRVKESSGLRHKPRPGPPPKTDPKTPERLPHLLGPGAMAYGFATDLGTTTRVAQIMEQEFGAHYHRDHACRSLHALGMGWQRSERRALEGGEAGIQAWIQDC